NRAPIHHSLAAVNLSFPEKIDEHRQDRARIMRIHRKLGAAPVAGGTERLKLLEDHSPLLLAPRPHLLEEFLAPKVASMLLLLAQLALDHGLRGDPGMIGSRLPKRLATLQPRATNQ